jgi:integrase
MSDKKLSAVFVMQVSQPGRYHDGGGLYLQVRSASEKSWLFRFRRNWMGLGPLRDVSLAEARAAAAKCRKMLLAGIDPLEARRSEKMKAKLDSVSGTTFRQCAERYIASHQAAWKNPKHRQQWSNTLVAYAYPVFGEISVGAVDTGLVIKALEPIWTTKPETASRLRGRIESVLDWAKARGYRQGENPARWRGHIDHLLPPRRKVRAVNHHAALPYAEMHDFMHELRRREGIAARALEFVILTAVRTGEAIGARWDEIAGDVWTIPAERMKSGREHRVPLSDAALELLAALPREGDYLFGGARPNTHLSNMALLAVLRRLDRADLTTHGFRSTFRDWVAERTNYPRDIAEAALAHAISDKTEAAYRRGDALDKRRRLMAEWARYCAEPIPTGDVVALHA